VALMSVYRALLSVCFENMLDSFECIMSVMSFF